MILGLGNCELDANSRHGRYLAGSLLQAHHGRVLSLSGQDVFYRPQWLAQLWVSCWFNCGRHIVQLVRCLHAKGGRNKRPSRKLVAVRLLRGREVPSASDGGACQPERGMEDKCGRGGKSDSKALDAVLGPKMGYSGGA